MSRLNLILGGVAALALVLAGVMFFQKQGLEDELTTAQGKVAAYEGGGAAGDPWANDGSGSAGRSGAIKGGAAQPLGQGPALDQPKKESVMARRARMTEMIQAMFGRGENETEEEYKARIGPMITGYLEKPRGYAVKRRASAEAKAGVTPEQSAKIDAEVNKIYDDVLNYTNQAISDGQVSPYSRNVSGWLQYAGGLGSILNDAEARFGKILSGQQLKTMYDMGFEWSEYLGLNAPWEKLNAPPPPPGGGI